MSSHGCLTLLACAALLGACADDTSTNPTAATASTNDPTAAAPTAGRKSWEPVPGACTYTQGYWKTHSEFGPAAHYDDAWAQLSAGASTTFFLSGQTWLEVFRTPPRGNAYYILAHQYEAAWLNVLNGSGDAVISEALYGAEAFFQAYTPTGWPSGMRDQLIAWAGTLGDFNEGLIGPGHCDE